MHASALVCIQGAMIGSNEFEEAPLVNKLLIICIQTEILGLIMFLSEKKVDRGCEIRTCCSHVFYLEK